MQENKPSATPQSPNPTAKSGFTEIFGGILLISAILIFLALSSFQSQINKGLEPLAEYNLIGSLGHYSAEMLFLMFGKSAFLLGPYFLLLGALTIVRGGFSDPLARLTAILIMIVGSSILGAVLYTKEAIPSQVVGGLIGARMGGAVTKFVRPLRQRNFFYGDINVWYFSCHSYAHVTLFDAFSGFAPASSETLC